MSPAWYRGLVIAGIALVAVAVNASVWQRESLLRDGERLVLELAPVDPRSLMQGDYMALRFAVAAPVRPQGAAPTAGDPLARDGTLVLARDARGVGRFVRILREGEALAAGELKLRYRLRRNDVRIVTNAWFFEEGQGARYAAARFGELRVGADGEALLTGMLDKDLKPIPSAKAPEGASPPR